MCRDKMLYGGVGGVLMPCMPVIVSLIPNDGTQHVGFSPTRQEGALQEYIYGTWACTNTTPVNCPLGEPSHPKRTL